MNTPPSPDLVCVIAFVHSSDTHVTRVSLAGQPASSADTNARARSTETGVPGKTRVDRSLPSDHRSTGYAAVIAITPCTYTRYGADIIYLLLVTRSHIIWFSIRWNYPFLSLPFFVGSMPIPAKVRTGAQREETR